MMLIFVFNFYFLETQLCPYTSECLAFIVVRYNLCLTIADLDM